MPHLLTDELQGRFSFWTNGRPPDVPPPIDPLLPPTAPMEFISERPDLVVGSAPPGTQEGTCGLLVHRGTSRIEAVNHESLIRR